MTAAHALPGLSRRAGAQAAMTRALPEEVPVALVYHGSTLAVMMATPADIADLARGFTLTEGIARPDQVTDLDIVQSASGIEARMWLDPDCAAALTERRRMLAGPVGCGLCGIESLEQALRPLPQVAGDWTLPQAEVMAAPDALRAHQPLHDQTRAMHAAGFWVAGQGIVMAREDVGRHNALDKLIGALLAAGLDPASGAAVLTSRVSTEMVQKSAYARAPVIIAVSAPTAQAVRLADGAGITLAALVRSDGFDLFTHAQRITD